MEFHFLPFVGNGVHTGLVAAQGEKVAALVVAAEEIGEIGENLVFEGLGIGIVLDGVAQFQHFGDGIGIDAQAAGVFDGLIEFRLFGQGNQPGMVGERSLDLREQVGFEKAGDFGALGVHHTIDAEVEVGLVEHKKLGQQVFQSIEIGVLHGRGPFYTTCQRMENKLRGQPLGH